MCQRHLSAGITELNAQLPQLYQQVSVRAVITRTEHLLHRLSISYTFRALSVHTTDGLLLVSFTGFSVCTRALIHGQNHVSPTD